MTKQAVQLYPVPHRILGSIVQIRRNRGERASNSSIVEELIIREAQKEGIHIKDIST